MSIMTKRMIILTVIVLIATVLGRLAVRAFLNLLLGGTLFGGNFLLNRKRKGGRIKCCGASFMQQHFL